jgi:hypothetical protein
LTEAEVRSFIHLQAFILYFCALFVIYVSEFSERGAFVIIQRFAFFKRRQANKPLRISLDGSGSKTCFCLAAWLAFRIGAHTHHVIEKGNGKHNTLGMIKIGAPQIGSRRRSFLMEVFFSRWCFQSRYIAAWFLYLRWPYRPVQRLVLHSA